MGGYKNAKKHGGLDFNFNITLPTNTSGINKYLLLHLLWVSMLSIFVSLPSLSLLFFVAAVAAAAVGCPVVSC